MYGLYGQPEDEYEVFMPFAETLLKCGQVGGFKLHVSVDPDHADRLARVILATLRLLHVHHKVVLPGLFYRNMNNGDQRGSSSPSIPAHRRNGLSTRSIRFCFACARRAFVRGQRRRHARAVIPGKRCGSAKAA